MKFFVCIAEHWLARRPHLIILSKYFIPSIFFKITLKSHYLMQVRELHGEASELNADIEDLCAEIRALCCDDDEL